VLQLEQRIKAGDALFLVSHRFARGERGAPLAREGAGASGDA
jgi:hypothetical protein